MMERFLAQERPAFDVRAQGFDAPVEMIDHHATERFHIDGVVFRVVGNLVEQLAQSRQGSHEGTTRERDSCSAVLAQLGDRPCDRGERGTGKGKFPERFDVAFADADNLQDRGGLPSRGPTR